MRVKIADNVVVLSDQSYYMLEVGRQRLSLSPVSRRIVTYLASSPGMHTDEIARRLQRDLGAPDSETSHAATTRQVQQLLAHSVLVECDKARRPAAFEIPHELFLDLLGSALAGQSQLPGLPLDSDTTAKLLSVAQRHRLLPLLYRARPQLNIDETELARLEAAEQNNLMRCSALSSQLHRVIAILDGARIPYLVFKGLALSVQVHGDPAARGFGDIDILVAPRNVARAYSELERGGWSPHSQFPDPAAGWAWRHMLRTVNELPFYDDGVSVDLHWSAFAAQRSFPSFDALWRRREYVNIMGVDVPTFSLYDALAHSAGHSAKDDWRTLRALVDVHRLICEPGTWEGADRKLRHDQIVTIGLATHFLGLPDTAPSVVRNAHLISAKRWACLPNILSSREAASRTLYPAQQLFHYLKTAVRTRASGIDYARHIVAVSVPASSAKQYPGSLFKGLPRALTHRTFGLIQQIRAMLRQCL